MKFLQELFYFHPIGGLVVRVVSKNRPGYYWSIDEGIEGYLMQEAELFKVVSPGLYGEGSVSFESVSRPGHYLVNREGMIFVEQGDVYSEEFRRDCSWFVRKDMFFTGFVNLKSVN